MLTKTRPPANIRVALKRAARDIGDLPPLSKRTPIAEATHKRSAQPADIALGDSVRLRRLALGMSQTVLGDRLGVTFQQVQKYENGANRIAGARLIKAAAVLKTTLAALTGEAVVAGQTGIASPMLTLIARSEPTRRLMVAVQRLHAVKRSAAIADLARAAEQMMRPT